MPDSSPGPVLPLDHPSRPGAVGGELVMFVTFARISHLRPRQCFDLRPLDSDSFALKMSRAYFDLWPLASFVDA